MLLRCLLGLQPNPAQRGGLGENIIYNPLWSLLLQEYDFWVKECWSNLPEVHPELFQRSNWAQRTRLCGRRRYQVSESRVTH